MLKFFVSVHVLWTSAGFVLGFDSMSSHFWMKNYKNSLETRFTECAGSRVFGIHTVVYVRRIYDKKRKSFVTQEVKHPDTIYVLPDLPYFYKMDNTYNKGKREKIIQTLQKMNLVLNYHGLTIALLVFYSHVLY